MPKGGARLNSGPPPDPDALRRDRASDKAGWTLLPAAGRQGDTPPFPLPADAKMSAAIEVGERSREILEAQIDGGMAVRNGPARLAKIDQQLAELRYRLEHASGMEAELWATLWATPQAVVWEQMRWTREVALYARLQVLAELGDLDAGKEARQWSDRLGLNPTALLRNRWKIEGALATNATPKKAPRKRSASARLQVLEGGKGGANGGDDGGSA